MDRKFKNILGKCRKAIPCACLFFMLMLCGPSCFSFTLVPDALTMQSFDIPIKVDFNFDAKDRSGREIYNDSGTITLCGNKFRMEVADDLVMVSDGVTLWVYKPQSEDIIIMEAQMAGLSSTQSEEPLHHPTADASLEQAMQNMATLFGYSDGTSSKIEIIRGANGLPSQIRFISKDNSSYTIKIKSVKPIGRDELTESYFTLQVREYPNAIVTDLR